VKHSISMLISNQVFPDSAAVASPVVEGIDTTVRSPGGSPHASLVNPSRVVSALRLVGRDSEPPSAADSPRAPSSLMMDEVTPLSPPNRSPGSDSSPAAPGVVPVVAQHL
jgi:hypothetical protein